MPKVNSEAWHDKPCVGPWSRSSPVFKRKWLWKLVRCQFPEFISQKILFVPTRPEQFTLHHHHPRGKEFAPADQHTAPRQHQVTTLGNPLQPPS